MRLEPTRAAVASSRPWARDRPAHALLAPTARSRRANAEPLGRLAMYQTMGNCRQNTNPKIRPTALSTCLPASLLADSLNHLAADSGTPHDSLRWDVLAPNVEGSSTFSLDAHRNFVDTTC
jgi:hypothetical protein